VAYTALLQKVYADFGFTHIIYKVATRPGAHRRRRVWDKAEFALMESLRRSGCDLRDRARGRGVLRPEDRIHAEGRDRTAVAVRHDAGRFLDASVWTRSMWAKDGARRHPVMLHRAIVGSLERFIGILIEQFAGALPAWLAPVQVSVLNITDAQAEYARSVAKTLQNQGLRVQLDLRNEKITYKIREHSLQKPPFILVVGDKEMAAGAVAVRARGNKDLGVMSLEAFVQKIVQETSQAQSVV
jgi:threonyl-tRNA synthetase